MPLHQSVPPSVNIWYLYICIIKVIVIEMILINLLLGPYRSSFPYIRVFMDSSRRPPSRIVHSDAPSFPFWHPKVFKLTLFLLTRGSAPFSYKFQWKTLFTFYSVDSDWIYCLWLMLILRHSCFETGYHTVHCTVK